MTAREFAQHAHRRLGTQVAIANFGALVARPGLKTFAIWDDHDFLWNGACGGEIAGQPTLSPLIAPSRAVFAAYRKALAAGLAAGYSNIALADKLMLHLTDGRSFKTRPGRRQTLLGQAQRSAIEAACGAADPDTGHLVASGVVFDARHGETWVDCQADYQWMLALAARFKMLILSGDIDWQ